MIVVASILAILATFFLATYPASQRRARDTQRVTDLEQYRNALQLYANANELRYPPGNAIPLHGLCQNVLTNFASNCPADPTIENNYRYVAVNNGENFYVYTQLEVGPDTGGSDKVYYVTTSYGESGIVEDTRAQGKSGIPPFK